MGPMTWFYLAQAMTYLSLYLLINYSVVAKGEPAPYGIINWSSYMSAIWVMVIYVIYVSVWLGLYGLSTLKKGYFEDEATSNETFAESVSTEKLEEGLTLIILN